MKSQNNQLKSADIGHEFCVLTKTKHVGHVSHSIFVPEFEFDHNILKFLKNAEFSVSPGSCLDCFPYSEISVFLRISKYDDQIQTKGQKLSWKHAPHVYFWLKHKIHGQCQLISADCFGISK